MARCYAPLTPPRGSGAITPVSAAQQPPGSPPPGSSPPASPPSSGKDAPERPAAAPSGIGAERTGGRDPSARASAPPGPAELFRGYLRVGTLGFGGVAAWSRRVIVEERGWLTEREYAELLGLGQVLPGPNVGNAAVMIGRRFGGARGALAAMGGLYAGPLAVLLLLATAWASLSALPGAEQAMTGVAAAAAGMTLGNALRMGERLRLGPALLLLAALSALAATWLRLPLPLIVLGLGPVGTWLSWREAAR